MVREVFPLSEGMSVHIKERSTISNVEIKDNQERLFVHEQSSEGLTSNNPHTRENHEISSHQLDKDVKIANIQFSTFVNLR